MIKLHEKRHSIRHRCEGRVTLLHTQSLFRDIDARLLNFSENGISFSSRQPLSPGTTIVVRSSAGNYRQLSAESTCQVRTMGVATVKWCQESQDQEDPIHEMGAVYLLPY